MPPTPLQVSLIFSSLITHLFSKSVFNLQKTEEEVLLERNRTGNSWEFLALGLPNCINPVPRQSIKTLHLGKGFTWSFDQYDYGESYLPFFEGLSSKLRENLQHQQAVTKNR